METCLKPPRPPRSLEPWWNPGGTLVKPSSNPQLSKKLVEPWWNPRGTLVEPYLKPPQTTPPLQNLVEPWWNPGGTLVEPWWNPGGTLVEPLVEPWWNLSSGSPRTTSEPIWAETPKLSAVGDKEKTKPNQPTNSTGVGPSDLTHIVIYYVCAKDLVWFVAPLFFSRSLHTYPRVTFAQQCSAWTAAWAGSPVSGWALIAR